LVLVDKESPLAGFVRIVIRASGSHPDVLTIRDAIDQVRDIFELAESDDPSVAWKLVSATTNSPLTIVAELVAVEPNISPIALAALADARTRELREGISALERGAIIPSWARGRKATTLKRLLNRSLNGVGRTDVQVNDEAERETITPQTAQRALRAIDAPPEIDRARVEIGSIDGEYVEIGTHYAHPAIKLRERKTGAEIWCWVSEGDLERFSERVRAVDVWRHKAVRARGKILYDRDGGVLHIEAHDVQLTEVPRVTLDEVRDANFTGGLRVSEYLDRLREGGLG
jgi:hypothetical protein